MDLLLNDQRQQLTVLNLNGEVDGVPTADHSVYSETFKELYN